LRCAAHRYALCYVASNTGLFSFTENHVCQLGKQLRALALMRVGARHART